MRNLTRRHVDLILIRHGKNQVGVFHAGAFEYAGMGCGACHGSDIEPVLQSGKLF